MDEYGTMVELWHVRENGSYPKETLLQCHFVYYESHIKQPGFEPGSLG
jgi:hypothetical protein